MQTQRGCRKPGASQQQHMQICAILKTALMLSRMPGDVKEARQPRGDRRCLFLLHPVAGAVDELDAFELWTGAFHRVEAAGALIDAPVALARHEQRANIDRPSREQLELRREPGHTSDAIRLQAALET